MHVAVHTWDGQREGRVAVPLGAWTARYDLQAGELGEWTSWNFPETSGGFHSKTVSWGPASISKKHQATWHLLCTLGWRGTQVVLQTSTNSILGLSPAQQVNWCEGFLDNQYLRAVLELGYIQQVRFSLLPQQHRDGAEGTRGKRLWGLAGSNRK